jgi:hypothetical protein
MIWSVLAETPVARNKLEECAKESESIILIAVCAGKDYKP